MSRPSSATEPDVGSQQRAAAARAVVDLPQPRLADDPERLALAHVERHARRPRARAARRAARAPRQREVLDEVAHLDQRAAHGAARRRRAGRVGRAGGRAPRGVAPAAAPPQRAPRRAPAGTPPGGRGSPATGSSAGRTRRCASRTYGQRGWKWQPLGRSTRLGGRPGIATSSLAARALQARDRAAAGPTCRGARARRRASPSAPARRSARRTSPRRRRPARRRSRGRG